MAPPTPPDIDGAELHEGFHQLLQHNAGGQTQQGPHVLGHSPYVQSRPTATYSTPEPELEGQWYFDQYGDKRLVYNDHGNLVEEVQYNGYGQPALNSYHGSPYQGHPLPQQQQQHYYPNPAFYSASPPPTNSDQDTPPRRGTRKSRLATDTSSRHSSPKPKRKAAKAAKPKTLAGPLSELTKHMDNVPLKDTETWVNRPIEVRRQEAAKGQKVKRPCNSFILYRSAYADRARSFQKSATRANHQIVSSIAGESWQMEPPEVKKQYDEWAKLERDNHKIAFPEYKFQPQTDKASARKRKGRDDESEEEESDLESDYACNPRGSGRALQSKRSRTTYRESSYTPSGTSLDEYDASNLYHQSSHQMVNPGQPLPPHLNQLGGAQYYHRTSHPSQRYTGHGLVEDVFVQPTDAPAGYHQQSAPVIGIPGAYHHELQSDNGELNLGTMSASNQIDPMLATYDQGQQGLSLSNGPATHAQEMPQSAGFPIGQYSPVLNDFEDELGGAEMGSDEWWDQNKDR